MKNKIEKAALLLLLFVLSAIIVVMVSLMVVASLMAVGIVTIEDCPKGMTCCPTRNWDYVVVDSVGRRFRPVPCAPESYECDQCGDFAPALEADDVAQEDEIPVTLIYDDGKRVRKTFYFTYDCGYECSPTVRLERIK